MAGDVDAEHLFFAGQLLLRGPIGQRGQRMFDVLRLAGDHAEQVRLVRSRGPSRPLAAFHRVFDHGGQLRAIAAQAGPSRRP